MKAYTFDTDCPDCIAARLHMKGEGFRDWRTAYACHEHAALDLNSPEMIERFSVCTEEGIRAACKQMGLPYIAPATADQPDLFGAAA